jgi:hypothetical protein
MVRAAAGEMPQLQSSEAYTSKQYEYTDAGFAAPEVALGGAMVTADVYREAFNRRREFVPTMGLSQLRKVQQFLTDHNDNIPLAKRVIYEGPVFLTDETDQELVYRVPVQELLVKHNTYRVTVRDKSFRDKEVFLEEARIRELTLSTITLAQI